MSVRLGVRDDMVEEIFTALLNGTEKAGGSDEVRDDDPIVIKWREQSHHAIQMIWEIVLRRIPGDLSDEGGLDVNPFGIHQCALSLVENG
jgi:hypothetical protein